jgi:hypothetical protein
MTTPNLDELKVVPDAANSDAASVHPLAPIPSVEIGGREGPEPTRYGDWEKNGRCIDF